MNWDKFSFLYDWELNHLNSDQEEEFKFWRSFVRKNGDTILELGAGSGRITKELLSTGCKVTAIDNSAEMLKRLRTLCAESGEEVKVVESGMEDFRLDSLYDCCIISYSSFQHLLSVSEQEKCLKRIHSHLKVAGKLCIDLDNEVISPEAELPLQKMYSEYNKELKAQIDMFTAWITKGKIRHWYDKYYIQYDNSCFQSLENHIALRQVTLSDIKKKLSKTGFKLINTYGSYNKEKYTTAAHRLIIVAQKY